MDPSCKSMLKIVFTARLAASKWWMNTLNGQCLKETEALITRACDLFYKKCEVLDRNTLRNIL